MRTMSRIWAILLCLCLIAPCAALAEEMELALTDTTDCEVVSAPVEAAPEEEAFALQPDAPQEAAAVSAPAEDAQPKGSGVAINLTNFPDANFRAYVSESFDKDNDGILSSKEIAAAKTIHCYDTVFMSSMEGIEYFTEATSIAYIGSMKNLDFRKNTKLKILSCQDDQELRNLDLRNNTELEELYLDDCCELEKLNLSKCTKLKTLDIDDCFWGKLDLTKCTKLKRIKLENTGVKSLDLSKNTQLEEVDLDCEAMPKLVLGRYGKLKRLVIGYSNVKSLDLSKSTELEELCLSNCCNVSKLDISKCRKLKTLVLYDNDNLKKINIRHCPKLLDCVQKGKKTKSEYDNAVSYTYGTRYIKVNGKTTLYVGPVKKVQITKGKKATMKVGGKLKLKAKLSPAGAASKLTWKSSNTKVATVSSSGVVKAKKKGTAKITVKTANGKKATIKITVKAKPVELAGYLNMNIYEAARKMGLKVHVSSKPFAPLEPDYKPKSCSTDDFTFGNTFNGPQDAVGKIELKHGSKYMLCGISIGMDIWKARETAIAYFQGTEKMWSIDEDPKSGGKKLFIISYGNMIEVSMKNGKVSHVLFGYNLSGIMP